jgi:hypothetical protein
MRVEMGMGSSTMNIFNLSGLITLSIVSRKCLAKVYTTYSLPLVGGNQGEGEINFG